MNVPLGAHNSLEKCFMTLFFVVKVSGWHESLGSQCCPPVSFLTHAFV